jgi:hypothetical protein
VSPKYSAALNPSLKIMAALSAITAAVVGVIAFGLLFLLV